MRGAQVVDEEVQVVLVGDFNPSIFNPQWFALKTLMTEKEAEQAEIEICHQEVSKFTADWYQIEVFQTRFVARTKHMGRIEELRDFVAATFEILAETPIRALGINKQTEYRCPSTRAWHALGDTLAPKDIWRGILQTEDVGMKFLELRSARTDDIPGAHNISIYPVLPPQSSSMSNVIFKVNAHFDLQQAIEEKKIYSLYAALMDLFETEVEFAKTISDRVLEQVDENGNNSRNI